MRSLDTWKFLAVLCFSFLSSCKEAQPRKFLGPGESSTKESPEGLRPIEGLSGGSPEQESASDETPGSAVPLESYSLSEFVNPMTNASSGSPWCACRNIGTSPHIGLDLNGVAGNELSLALSDGTVTDVDFDRACGEIIWFEDKFGALWRYVHLDKTGHQAGDRFFSGQPIGVNRSYPRSGCGSGAHLHIERRSAGRHPGEETSKNCQRGRRTCYFDPTLVEEMQTLSAPRKAEQMGRFSLSGGTPLPSGNAVSAFTVLPQATAACSSSVRPTLSQLRPGLLPVTRELEASLELSENLKDEVRLQVSELVLSDEKQSPFRNPCLSADELCVVEMSLFQEQESEIFHLVDLTGLRGSQPKLDRSMRVCVSAVVERYWIVLTLSNGERTTVRIRMQRGPAGQ